MIKKITGLALALVLLLSSLAGCGAADNKTEKNVDGKLQIIATIFPEYDWVKNILGENPAGAETTLLLNNGVDLHSFQPTAADIMKISECDLFIYVGGESDGWVEDALKEAVNKDMVVINLLESLGTRAKEEEIVEGMEHEHDEEDHEHEEEHADEEHEGKEHEHEHEEAELDEHVWLSLQNSSVLVEGISEALQKIDPDHAEEYKKNTEVYLTKIAELDQKYQAAVSAGRVSTVLFGDRFPFRYLTDDYGLSYYAAFSGCSAETEASFETVAFLSEKLQELGLESVLTIEGTNHGIAETIIGNTAEKDQKVLVLDSMQSTTEEDIKAGASYLGIMEKNLEVLKEALQ